MPRAPSFSSSNCPSRATIAQSLKGYNCFLPNVAGAASPFALMVAADELGHDEDHWMAKQWYQLLAAYLGTFGAVFGGLCAIKRFDIQRYARWEKERAEKELQGEQLIARVGQINHEAQAKLARQHQSYPFWWYRFFLEGLGGMGAALVPFVAFRVAILTPAGCFQDDKPNGAEQAYYGITGGVAFFSLIVCGLYSTLFEPLYRSYRKGEMTTEVREFINSCLFSWHEKTRSGIQCFLNIPGAFAVAWTMFAIISAFSYGVSGVDLFEFPSYIVMASVVSVLSGINAKVWYKPEGKEYEVVDQEDDDLGWERKGGECEDADGDLEEDEDSCAMIPMRHHTHKQGESACPSLMQGLYTYNHILLRVIGASSPWAFAVVADESSHGRDGFMAQPWYQGVALLVAAIGLGIGVYCDKEQRRVQQIPDRATRSAALEQQNQSTLFQIYRFLLEAVGAMGCVLAPLTALRLGLLQFMSNDFDPTSSSSASEIYFYITGMLSWAAMIQGVIYTFCETMLNDGLDVSQLLPGWTKWLAQKTLSWHEKSKPVVSHVLNVGGAFAVVWGMFAMLNALYFISSDDHSSLYEDAPGYTFVAVALALLSRFNAKYWYGHQQEAQAPSGYMSLPGGQEVCGFELSRGADADDADDDLPKGAVERAQQGILVQVRRWMQDAWADDHGFETEAAKAARMKQAADAYRHRAVILQQRS